MLYAFKGAIFPIKNLILYKMWTFRKLGGGGGAYAPYAPSPPAYGPDSIVFFILNITDKK